MFFLPMSIFAQEKLAIPANAVKLNFSAGTFASLEYERVIAKKSSFFVLASIGAGAGTEGSLKIDFGDNTPTYFYPVAAQSITYNFGKRRSFLEAGLGGILVFGPTTQPYLVFPKLGYRFVGDNNSTFSVYVAMPFSGLQTDDLLFVPVGISFGQFF